MLIQQSNIALGSKTELTIVSSSEDVDTDTVFRELWLQIFTFERTFSRFLPGSELSAFNRSAGLDTSISSEFHDLLATAQRYAQDTKGLFNPFILPALQKAGYVHSMVAAYAEDPVENYERRKVVPPEALSLHQHSSTIPYGSAIDFGGIGKGYLADKLAEYMKSLADIAGYWFSLGGDVVASGVDERGVEWSVEIEDTSGKNNIAGSVSVTKGERTAVATSSTTARKGIKAGVAWHHIIDPRTNLPAVSDIATATVVAASATRADIVATCLIILGSAEAIPFAKTMDTDGVLLQLSDGRVISSGKIRTLNA